MILAGDIGGTKCNLAAFEPRGATLHLVFQNRYATRDFSSFEKLVDTFCLEVAPHQTTQSRSLFDAAGFGVAGTVLDGRLISNNLPWSLDVTALATQLHLRAEGILVMNDLVATACAVDKLPPTDLLALNDATAQYKASKALIAAGTGLGQAMLFWDGVHYRAAASEGGAADFAPRTEREARLLDFLRRSLPRVFCEEVLSGRGFRRIHEFLDPTVRHPSFDEPANDSARDITQRALAGTCHTCGQALDLWVEAFASEAGNLALRTLAYGGIYLAGGIVLKILPKLKKSFARSFSDKPPLSSVLAHVPILVILNEDAPLLGAAYQALAATQSRSDTPRNALFRSSAV
jgi:glucokinase